MKQKLKIIVFVELAVLLLLGGVCFRLLSGTPDDPQETPGASQNFTTGGSTPGATTPESTGDIQGIVDNPFATVAPTEPFVQPSISTAEPTEPSTHPTEKPNEPTEKPNQPTEKPNQPTEKPNESTVKPNEPSVETTEPTQEPSQPAASMDYETYIGLSSQEQKAYRETFESTAAFFEWFNAAKEEYESQKSEIDIGGGSVDLGDLIGGKDEE